jgi:hypothetical protein
LREQVIRMGQYNVGDIVKMRKKHPCGSDEWEIMRTGMDFRIKCSKCARQVWLDRPSFEKAVKKIVRQGEPGEGDNLTP